MDFIYGQPDTAGYALMLDVRLFVTIDSESDRRYFHIIILKECETLNESPRLDVISLLKYRDFSIWEVSLLSQS